MPITKICILEGKSQAYKSAILDCVHATMVECLGKQENDRRQIICEYNPTSFEHVGRTEFYTFIEVFLIKGRNFDAKKRFYRELVDNLSQKLGIPPNDITIILNEHPAENWGIRGGFPASEVDFKK